MSRHFSSRVTTSPDVLLRIIGDEAVILNLKSELYLGLDPIGTRIWTVLQGSPSIQAMHPCSTSSRSSRNASARIWTAFSTRCSRRDSSSCIPARP